MSHVNAAERRVPEGEAVDGAAALADFDRRHPLKSFEGFER